MAFKPIDQTIVRRSGNYKSSTLNYDAALSLNTEYVGEPYAAKAAELKAEVRKMLLDKALKPLHLLELIDASQRLGLYYHFEGLIKSILKNMFMDLKHVEDTKMEVDLYATALKFRLLRQHGHKEPQEVFNRFKEAVEGNFKSSLYNDVKGMLYLYEATFYSVEGETILDEARDFTIKNLEKSVKQYCNSNNNNDDEYLAKLVSHALEVPLAWGMLRFEAYWFINVYDTNPDMELVLLELAKLDFNMVQAVHQEDLKHSFRWWNDTGLGEKLDFSRDWMDINFYWSIGMIFEPHFQYGRRYLAKACELITVVDDVYDVYGTLEELEIFTDVFTRWDVNAMDQLPSYMKLLFLAVYNTTHEMGYQVLRDQGVDIIPYLKKVWAQYCNSALLEARWYYSGHTPTLQEYLDNAWITVGGPTMLLHSYFGVTNLTTPAASVCLEEYTDMIRWSSMFVRLMDDLGTTKGELERGDTPKSIQCYMHETGVSEEAAASHIRYPLSETWKKLNGVRFVNPSFSQTFIEVALNMARIAHCTYRHGGDYDTVLHQCDKKIKALFVQPMSLD